MNNKKFWGILVRYYSSKNPRFVGMKFPEINKPETLERRYLGKLSKKALNIMKGMLKINEKERLTVD